ncbi:hypothetical protein ATO6_20010 [Oceanicola sp. 22II-s10i]|nr:hypothetical protein ATO6_20010 [Oceanicola sp. 22II-s10i]
MIEEPASSPRRCIKKRRVAERAISVCNCDSTSPVFGRGHGHRFQSIRRGHRMCDMVGHDLPSF